MIGKEGGDEFQAERIKLVEIYWILLFSFTPLEKRLSSFVPSPTYEQKRNELLRKCFLGLFFLNSVKKKSQRV